MDGHILNACHLGEWYITYQLVTDIYKIGEMYIRNIDISVGIDIELVHLH